jgi:hypothetical protein
VEQPPVFARRFPFVAERSSSQRALLLVAKWKTGFPNGSAVVKG